MLLQDLKKQENFKIKYFSPLGSLNKCIILNFLGTSNSSKTPGMDFKDIDREWVKNV